MNVNSSFWGQVLAVPQNPTCFQYNVVVVFNCTVIFAHNSFFSADITQPNLMDSVINRAKMV